MNVSSPGPAAPGGLTCPYRFKQHANDEESHHGVCRSTNATHMSVPFLVVVQLLHGSLPRFQSEDPEQVRATQLPQRLPLLLSQALPLARTKGHEYFLLFGSKRSRLVLNLLEQLIKAGNCTLVPASVSKEFATYHILRTAPASRMQTVSQAICSRCQRSAVDW